MSKKCQNRLLGDEDYKLKKMFMKEAANTRVCIF